MSVLQPISTLVDFRIDTDLLDEGSTECTDRQPSFGTKKRRTSIFQNGVFGETSQ